MEAVHGEHALHVAEVGKSELILIEAHSKVQHILFLRHSFLPLALLPARQKKGREVDRRTERPRWGGGGRG